MSLLTLTLAAPLAGALAILFVPKERTRLVHVLALASSGVALLLSGVLWQRFDASYTGMQFIERLSWIPAFNVYYSLGVDGLSLPMVALTALLSFVSIVASLGIQQRVKEYFFWFLILEVGMLGVFESLDFVLFYVFWEVTLVPMYFLIGIWGGPQKEYAAIKFFLYTLVGSVFMLLAILALYFNSDPHTFDMLELARQHGPWGMRFQQLAFLGFYLAFAIKIPAFPFHTWLPLAHVEAPTAVSVILAGVLLKMGTYGLMRVCFPILPEATQWFMPTFAALAVVNIVYGAFTSMAQTDFKKMIAYSSINHMGYAMLGMSALTATGFNGAVLEMVNHGIITGSLFMLVGVLYDRAHQRDLDAFGGLGAKVPVYAGIVTVASFASLGLPGLAGFISEFLCFLGAFEVWKLHTVLSVAGLLITAAFFLRMLEKVFLGPLNQRWAALEDINFRELCAVAPLTLLTVLLGIWPRLALDVMSPTLSALADLLK